MTKAEIIERIEALCGEESALDHLNEYNDLVSEFYKLHEAEEHEWEVAKLERIEAGEKPENIEKPVFELFSEFKVISATYKAKKQEESSAIRETEKKNLEKKRALIAALTDLIQNEENIGRAIGRYRDIMDSWKEVGPIPRDKRQAIQNDFSNLVDTFQYNINIYKEIKDHDLNRNLSLKKELIDKLKGLLTLKRIKEVETELHNLQNEWTNIGGTHQEEWDKIKDEYWSTVNAVYEKIREFYEGRRAERAENIEKKKELIEAAKAVVSGDFSDHKNWKKATDKLLSIQEDWKKIGFGSKDENDAVWKEFRSICNEFFDAKKAYYSEQSSEFEGVKNQKEELIQQAHELKVSTDWGETTKKIIALQKQWQKLGSAGPKFENKLWKKFREPIDAFFAAKDGHFEELDKANEANLEAKLALIEKIKGYSPDEDAKKAINDLKGFADEFGSVGPVPMKKKDEVFKAFKTAMDEKYGALKMDKSEKESILYRAKIESMAASSNSDQLIDKERAYIRSQIDKLNSTLNQYETNLSFFAHVDESNPLFKSANKSIEDTKAEIDSWKNKLKLIREVLA